MRICSDAVACVANDIMHTHPHRWDGREERHAISMTPSARMIIELNIKHYRDLLENEKDAAKRETIAKLLEEELGKLADLSKKETE